MRDGRQHWSLEAHLLDNLRMAQTGSKKKPAKPMPGRFAEHFKPSADREKARAAAVERARKREADIAAGLIR